MNKVINILIIGLFILMSINITIGQESCFVEYKNGDRVEADVKGFHSLDKKIKFKNLETGKKEKVLSEELESITYIISNDTLVFKRMKVKAFSAFGKLKDQKRPGWVAKLYGTDKMEGYLYCGSESSVSLNSLGNTKHYTFFTSAQAIKLSSEDHVFYIGAIKYEGIGGKRTARILMNRKLKKYLKDYCPEFSDKMNKNSYKTSELEKIIDEYTAQCK